MSCRDSFQWNSFVGRGLVRGSCRYVSQQHQHKLSRDLQLHPQPISGNGMDSLGMNRFYWKLLMLGRTREWPCAIIGTKGVLIYSSKNFPHPSATQPSFGDPCAMRCIVFSLNGGINAEQSLASYYPDSPRICCSSMDPPKVFLIPVPPNHFLVTRSLMFFFTQS